MNETATSCTVVGALIITIMFAAAIIVPGGNDSNTGLPMFLNSKVFTLFIICDALSLLSSSTSILMFLGILTSRYAEEDFLDTLPRKMIIGLSTLIFLIATLMITFCACLFIILHGWSFLSFALLVFQSPYLH
ncbi:ankyrin repeat-containing protein npr4 [Quercus suber]|uniref:Ankyrin repeat-containing protein npr4 n=1 Tax=Quercus suber TaxID=58331 RepID=A0AAW0JUI6_QUESU